MASPCSLIAIAVMLCILGTSHAGAAGPRRTLRAATQQPTASASSVPAAATLRQVYPREAPGFTGVGENLGPGSNPDPLFLYDYFDNPDYQRIEGPGSLGRTLGRLVGRINRRAEQTPRVSSAADATSFAFGDTTAEQRNTTVAVQNGPLRTIGIGTGGAVAIDPNFAFTSASTGAASVAKRIANDAGEDSKDFGAGGSSRGFTAATSYDANQNASTSTRVGSATSAGEQSIQQLALVPPGAVLLSNVDSGLKDGAAGRGYATSTGAGDKASTRLQTAALGAANSHTAGDGPGGPVTIGASILRSAADTVDSPFASAGNYSTYNTQSTLNNGGNVNRYGYSRAINTGTTSAVSTDKGRARTYGGAAGTGFATGQASADSTTYLPCQTEGNSCGDKTDSSSDGSSDSSTGSSTDSGTASSTDGADESTAVGV